MRCAPTASCWYASPPRCCRWRNATSCSERRPHRMFGPLDIPQLLAIAAVLGFASGIRLYLVLFAVGLAGFMQWVDLPVGLQVLSHPWVLAASGTMVAIEFCADK